MPYSDNPDSSLLDQVRILVGDTDPANPELTDNQVSFLLSEEGDNTVRAAARAAEVLAAKYAKRSDERRVGPLVLRNTRADQSTRYTKLAKQLWARAAGSSGSPYAGGISQSDKEAKASDPDRVHPIFAKDMMQYPAGTSPEATQDDRLL